MLKTGTGTQALIDLEDRAPDVLLESVRPSPVPLWPQVRDLVSIALHEADFDIAPVEAPEVPRTSAWLNLSKAFVPSRWDAAFARKKAPLCFVAGGGTVHMVDGRARNWLIGPYTELDPDRACVVQWAPITPKSTKPLFESTWSLDPLSVRAAGYAKLSRHDSASAVRLIVEEVLRLLDVEIKSAKVEAIVSAAAYRESLRPHIDKAVARLLDRVEPEVVLMDGASYGAWASIVVMMKERGIHVAEPQHGWIGPTHAAYNFGAAMHTQPLQATLPDELLTFGPYWSEGLRFPNKITVIGKPHIEAASGNLKPLDKRTEVLVVSSTSDPDEMSQFVTSLRTRLHREWTVVFRPHPSELPVVLERYPGLMDVPGVVIDTREDVYEALRSAVAVIGVASTVLFEAAAFGCKVVVRDGPLVDFYVGDRFGAPISSDEDLVAVATSINEKRFGDNSSHPLGDDMWAPGALDNFEKWLETTLINRGRDRK